MIYRIQRSNKWKCGYLESWGSIWCLRWIGRRYTWKISSLSECQYFQRSAKTGGGGSVWGSSALSRGHGINIGFPIVWASPIGEVEINTYYIKEEGSFQNIRQNYKQRMMPFFYLLFTWFDLNNRSCLIWWTVWIWPLPWNLPLWTVIKNMNKNELRMPKRHIQSNLWVWGI